MSHLITDSTVVIRESGVSGERRRRRRRCLDEPLKKTPAWPRLRQAAACLSGD